MRTVFKESLDVPSLLIIIIQEKTHGYDSSFVHSVSFMKGIDDVEASNFYSHTMNTREIRVHGMKIM